MVLKIFDGMCTTVNFPTKGDHALTSTLVLQRTEHTPYCGHLSGAEGSGWIPHSLHCLCEPAGLSHTPSGLSSDLQPYPGSQKQAR